RNSPPRPARSKPKIVAFVEYTVLASRYADTPVTAHTPASRVRVSDSRTAVTVAYSRTDTSVQRNTIPLRIERVINSVRLNRSRNPRIAWHGGNGCGFRTVRVG